MVPEDTRFRATVHPTLANHLSFSVKSISSDFRLGPPIRTKCPSRTIYTNHAHFRPWRGSALLKPPWRLLSGRGLDPEPGSLSQTGQQCHVHGGLEHLPEHAPWHLEAPVFQGDTYVTQIFGYVLIGCSRYIKKSLACCLRNSRYINKCKSQYTVHTHTHKMWLSLSYGSVSPNGVCGSCQN